MGNGSTSNSWVPIAVNTAGVLAGKTLVQIGSSLGILDNAANRASTCALDNAGKVYCWGYNGYGQLGNASNNNSFLPVAVSDAGVLASKVLTKLSVGDTHVCTLDSEGKAYCWGRNNYGQLGNGSTNDSNTPVAGREIGERRVGKECRSRWSPYH